jgi:uncharacterized protein with HEPN domain/predicted nucleotidyltransferase
MARPTKTTPLPNILAQRLGITADDIAEFCQRWHIQEFGLFGSVLRTDFRPESDVDVLIEVDQAAHHRPFHREQAQAELAQRMGRKVDLTQKRLLTNPFSQAEILKTYRVIYPPEAANFTTLIEGDKAMTEQVRDQAALLDMVKAMQAIARFLTGRDFDDLLADELLRSAVERQLEILGEAANRISAPFQAHHPEVDWRSVVGLRNVIIHQYDEIDYALLWEIVTENVPTLLAQVQPWVLPLPDHTDH